MEILIILDFSFIVSKNRLDFSWNRKKKRRERRRNVCSSCQCNKEGCVSKGQEGGGRERSREEQEEKGGSAGEEEDGEHKRHKNSI